jgi:hypothetical protein
VANKTRYATHLQNSENFLTDQIYQTKFIGVIYTEKPCPCEGHHINSNGYMTRCFSFKEGENRTPSLGFI